MNALFYFYICLFVIVSKRILTIYYRPWKLKSFSTPIWCKWDCRCKALQLLFLRCKFVLLQMHALHNRKIKTNLLGASEDSSVCPTKQQIILPPSSFAFVACLYLTEFCLSQKSFFYNLYSKLEYAFPRYVTIRINTYQYAGRCSR